MAGGNLLDINPHYASDVTSYDYNAPLSECGNYTAKYDKAEEMIAAYDDLSGALIKPPRPAFVPPISYPDVQMTEFINYDGIIANVVSFFILQS